MDWPQRTSAYYRGSRQDKIQFVFSRSEILFDKDAIATGIAQLRHKGFDFDEGLTDSEIAAIEERVEFIFPPDVRFFVQMALPLPPYFVN